ncbi:MAG TPA: DUF4136 domain-containing protein [Sphingobium sp.]|nr:DUF4136 domain-containing protein [Sphingobium sp.]
MTRRWISPLIPAAMLGGCATAVAPVDVTRFHTGGVPTTGTVALAPAPGIDGSAIEYRTYANAVAVALTRTGFTVAEPGSAARLTATVGYDVAVQRPYERGSPVSVGVGGATGSYGSGVGLGIGINLSGRPKPVIATRLSVRLSRSGTREALWEGRAETAAKEGTPAAQRGMAAAKLADALFRDYPGQSGATITVR